MTNDFRYVPYTNSSHPEVQLWHVMTGRTIVTTCRSEAAAQELIEELIRDRYFLMRGQTQKDRAKSYAF